MSVALATTGLLLGLAGGPHCALMCGALHAGVAHQADAAATRRAIASLHLGRIVGYSIAGAAVAASVSAFAQLGAASTALRPVWTMLQVAAVVLGLALLRTGKVPAWIASIGRSPRAAPTVPVIRFVRRVPPAVRAAGAGACWAAMPCGLLQSALIVAALANGAIQGAAVMSAFAVGTAISLGLVTSAWIGLPGVARHRWAGSTLPVRLAGVLLAASSALALMHGIGSDLVRVLCG